MPHQRSGLQPGADVCVICRTFIELLGHVLGRRDKARGLHGRQLLILRGSSGGEFELALIANHLMHTGVTHQFGNRVLSPAESRRWVLMDEVSSPPELLSVYACHE